jgi:hypothetical protein
MSEEFKLNAEPTQEKPTIDISEYEGEESEEIAPDMDSPEWTDYVLRQFEDDEMFDNRPKVDGLRRVAIKLLGQIVESQSRVVQAPNSDNDNHAVVEHTYVFEWNNNPSDRRTFTDVADTYKENTPVVNNVNYAVHSSSVASTKAKGRALREALQLRGVLAAEEMMHQLPTEQPKEINGGQIAGIKTLCSNLNVNVEKLLQMGVPPVDNIEDLSYTRAIKLLKLLNCYRNGSETIPNDILEDNA